MHSDENLARQQRQIKAGSTGRMMSSSSSVVLLLLKGRPQIPINQHWRNSKERQKLIKIFYGRHSQCCLWPTLSRCDNRTGQAAAESALIPGGPHLPQHSVASVHKSRLTRLSVISIHSETLCLSPTAAVLAGQRVIRRLEHERASHSAVIVAKRA